MTWLPEGKRAAICFTVDDVHPSTSSDGFEAGGDLSDGTLGRIEKLLERHAELNLTLFVTPDWRPVQLVRSRFLARIPMISEQVFHVDLHRNGRFRIDRWPAFVSYLNNLPRTEIAPHGLNHVSRGSKLAVEFQNQSYQECLEAVTESLAIFESAKLRYSRGFAPPGWNLPKPLADALDHLEFSFACSARDIRTPIARDARNSMSGLRHMPLIFPQRIGRNLVHIPTNFQATSRLDRADEIIRCNGLLSIKAHIFKRGGGFTLKDGLDDEYCAYLDRVFSHLDQRYGDSIWWASPTDIASRWLADDDHSMALAS